MNFIQFFLFTIYVLSMLAAGIGVYCFINPLSKDEMNRFVCLGEVFLFGSIIVVGEMMILSLLRLYVSWYLWGAVILNFMFLFSQTNRKKIISFFMQKVSWDFGLAGFILLVGIFVFRNCYFLVDVDSHSTYLFAQKLWLESKTSLIGSPAVDMRIFVPHFNAVPYALGLSIFPHGTLFPQLVVAFWTVIALLLVFGYTSYRFNHYYGLSAVMFVLFNDHMFYSGANQFVVINSALIAFLFAAAYNMWESRIHRSSLRFLFFIIFLSQLMANKYQMIYVCILFFIFSCIAQSTFFLRIKEIFQNKRQAVILGASTFIVSSWYIKNFLVTGCLTFPILAGNMGIFNWTPERQAAFLRGCGELPIFTFIKYMSYFFIWPGVNPAKYIIVIITVLPVILAILAFRARIDKDSVAETFFWLSLSVLATMGICMTNYTDPRVYRYAIAVLSFSVVCSVDYILSNVFNIKNKVFVAIILIVLSLPGYKIIYSAGVMSQIPSIKDNFGVLANKVHFEDIENRYFLYNKEIEAGIRENQDKFLDAAWDTGVGGGTSTTLSAFLLPTRPQLDLWHTSIVQWNSYSNEEAIAKDIRSYGIEWVMNVKDRVLVFCSPEEYAKKAIKYETSPQKTFYDYGFPNELTKVKNR